MTRLKHSHIVTGAAGSGTTTVAAALAAALARDGERVALVHSEQDAPPQLAGVATVAVRPLLWGEWALEAAAPIRALAGRPLAELAPSDVLLVPGLPELAWWHAIRDAWRDRSCSAVVVDAGPVGPATSMLTAPDTFTGLLRRLWPLAQRTGGAASADTGGAWHGLLIERLDDEAAEVASRLRSSATSLHLVMRPTEHDIERVLRALAPLALFELPVRQLVLNQASLRRPFDRALRDRLVGSLPGLRIGTARTSGDLGALAAELCPDGWRVRLREAGLSRPRLARADGEYRWRWTLPLADLSAARIAVAGDEALLSLGSVRRAVRLPSVLRRCRLSAAEAEHGALVMRFVPDPDLWPISWEVS